MRTTLAIDDDVLAAARQLAECEHKSVGEVISSLARHALRPTRHSRRIRNGVPLLAAKRGAARVTSELVNQLREEIS